MIPEVIVDWDSDRDYDSEYGMNRKPVRKPPTELENPLSLDLKVPSPPYSKQTEPGETETESDESDEESGAAAVMPHRINRLGTLIGQWNNPKLFVSEEIRRVIESTSRNYYGSPEENEKILLPKTSTVVRREKKEGKTRVRAREKQKYSESLRASHRIICHRFSPSRE